MTYSTTTFRENYLCARLVLPIQSHVPKVSSSSTFEDIDAAMVDMTLNDL